MTFVIHYPNIRPINVPFRGTASGVTTTRTSNTDSLPLSDTNLRESELRISTSTTGFACTIT